MGGQSVNMLTAMGLRAQCRSAILPDFFLAMDLLPILQMATLEMQWGKDDYISEHQSV